MTKYRIKHITYADNTVKYMPQKKLGIFFPFWMDLATWPIDSLYRAESEIADKKELDDSRRVVSVKFVSAD